MLHTIRPPPLFTQAFTLIRYFDFDIFSVNRQTVPILYVWCAIIPDKRDTLSREYPWMVLRIAIQRRENHSSVHNATVRIRDFLALCCMRVKFLSNVSRNTAQSALWQMKRYSTINEPPLEAPSIRVIFHQTKSRGFETLHRSKIVRCKSSTCDRLSRSLVTWPSVFPVERVLSKGTSVPRDVIILHRNQAHSLGWRYTWCISAPVKGRNAIDKGASPVRARDTDTKAVYVGCVGHPMHFLASPSRTVR